MIGGVGLIEGQFTEIIIAKQNRKYYESLGYDGCIIGNNIVVKISDLPRSSKAKINVVCDYCGEKMRRAYSNHLNQMKKDIIQKDSCVKCKGKKTKESNLQVYGVDNCMKLDWVRDNLKQSIQDKYGVDHPMHSQLVKDKLKQTVYERYGVNSCASLDWVQDKIVQTNIARYGKGRYTQTEEYVLRKTKTCLEKYGFENPFQNKEIQEKQRNTIYEKYGTSNVFQCERIKEKITQTNIAKYGVPHPMQNEDFKRRVVIKSRKALFVNGTTPTSRQQIYLNNLFGGILNYNIDHINVDIAFPEDKIYVEYDGGGHDLQVKIGRESFEAYRKKEIKRYYYLKSLGWKEIRIKSPRDYLPSDEILLNELEVARKWLEETGFGHSHYSIDLGSKVNHPIFGHMRKF